MSIGGQPPDLRLVDQRLRAVVEADEVAHEGKAGKAEAHLDPALILAGDFPLAKHRQRFADRQVSAPGLIDQVVELVADRRQLQPCQHPLQMVLHVRRHHHDPPAAASYALNGRNSGGAGTRAAAFAPAMRGPPMMPAKCAMSTIRPWRPARRRWHATCCPAWLTRRSVPVTGGADPLADQAPRHRIGVSIHLDSTVGRDPAHQVATRQDRRNAGDRLQTACLVPFEAASGWFAGGAVNPNLRNLAHPVVEMRLQRREAFEAASGDGIVLHIADAAFVLAFGAGPLVRGLWCGRDTARKPSPGTPDAGQRHAVSG